MADSLRVLALAVPFAALTDTLLGAARGYRDMRPTVVVDRVGRAACQLLGVLIAVSAGSVALLAPLWAVAYVPAAGVAWYWLRRIRHRQRPVGRDGRGRRERGQRERGRASGRTR